MSELRRRCAGQRTFVCRELFGEKGLALAIEKGRVATVERGKAACSNSRMSPERAGIVLEDIP
jgi:hypothetical protein